MVHSRRVPHFISLYFFVHARLWFIAFVVLRFAVCFPNLLLLDGFRRSYTYEELHFITSLILPVLCPGPEVQPRFLMLDLLLGGNLLQNSERNLTPEQKKTMALRHGSNLKNLGSYI